MRSALLTVAPALLLVSFTIARPEPLAAPALPPSFDGGTATALAQELAGTYPDRMPGTSGSAGAARWFEEKLSLYGLQTSVDVWGERVPGIGRVLLRNVAAVVPGTSSDAIVIVAHRDNSGEGPGANDNASGTAALIELARSYAKLGTSAGRPKPEHTLVFVSSDGGAYGGLGAERFAKSSLAQGARAVISLDAIAGRARPRLAVAGFEPRSPAPALVRTASARIAEQTGRDPALPGWLAQLVDLGIPFGVGEQAPFLGRSISSVRISTASDAAAEGATDVPSALDEARFARLGRAAESLLGSLDAGIDLPASTTGYLFLGKSAVRGWTIELVLIALLLPFLVGTVDLAARCRRRRLPLRGGWLSLRTRLGLWLWVGAVVGAGAVVGVFPRGSSIPPPPGSPAVSNWPTAGLLVLGGLIAAGWWRARRRLVASTPPRPDEELAGYAVALLALGGVAVWTAMLNPFALVFVVPSLYAWLWLPHLQRSGWARDALYGVGLVGPALALVSVAEQLGLGLDAPLYVTALATLGFVPWTTVIALIGWAAVAAQLGALAAGRYADGQSSR